jgi:hypothetical protein
MLNADDNYYIIIAVFKIKSSLLSPFNPLQMPIFDSSCYKDEVVGDFTEPCRINFI